jgi:hypothetical protein
MLYTAHMLYQLLNTPPPKISVIIDLGFYIYIQMNDDESRPIYINYRMNPFKR